MEVDEQDECNLVSPTKQLMTKGRPADLGGEPGRPDVTRLPSPVVGLLSPMTGCAQRSANNVGLESGHGDTARGPEKARPRPF